MRPACAVVLAFAATACRASDRARAADPFDLLPRRSLEEVRAALPEPNSDAAYVFDGVLRDHGPGRLRIAVEPGTFRGAPAWFVAQESEERHGPSRPPELERRTMWLSPELRVVEGRVTLTTKDGITTTKDIPPGTDGTATLAGALLFFRSIPAEAAAFGEPPNCPHVNRFDDDGTMRCAAPTIDSHDVHARLRGPHREIVEIRRTLGWHDLGTCVPREPSSR